MAQKRSPGAGKSTQPQITAAMAKVVGKMAAASSSQPPHAQRELLQSIEADSDLEDVETTQSTQMVSQTSILMKQFDKMLHRALNASTKQLMLKMDSLALEIRDLGARTAATEDRVDELAEVVSGQAQSLMELRDNHQFLLDKMEDMENRSRRSNLRLRGIPEHVTDVSSFTTALFQELAPSLPLERLEMDRVHRALTRKKQDGPPRDLVIKFHYYCTRDQLYRLAREKSSIAPLTFQGYSYQIYADLAPSTVQKRREMRPYLQELQNNRIQYKWGYPFKLLFKYADKMYACSSTAELAKAVRSLGLSNDHNRERASPVKKKAKLSTTPENNQAPPEDMDNTPAPSSEACG